MRNHIFDMFTENELINVFHLFLRNIFTSKFKNNSFGLIEFSSILNAQFI